MDARNLKVTLKEGASEIPYVKVYNGTDYYYRTGITAIEIAGFGKVDLVTERISTIVSKIPTSQPEKHSEDVKITKFTKSALEISVPFEKFVTLFESDVKKEICESKPIPEIKSSRKETKSSCEPLI